MSEDSAETQWAIHPLAHDGCMTHRLCTCLSRHRETPPLDSDRLCSYMPSKPKPCGSSVFKVLTVQDGSSSIRCHMKPITSLISSWEWTGVPRDLKRPDFRWWKLRLKVLVGSKSHGLGLHQSPAPVSPLRIYTLLRVPRSISDIQTEQFFVAGDSNSTLEYPLHSLQTRCLPTQQWHPKTSTDNACLLWGQIGPRIRATITTDYKFYGFFLFSDKLIQSPRF